MSFQLEISGLLDAVEQFVNRFVAYPSEDARIAHVLWIVHAHCMDQWDSTPRIAFTSPEPASGKSRALEVSEPLVPRPIEAVNTTPAYLFRKVSDPDGLPTILFDEIDTVFGPKAKDNEEVRGMLNAGHRRGAMAGRCVTRGNTITTEELPAYCAVAMAGLGDLPDTILSRSIVIQMRRRRPDEHVEPYRRRIHGAEGNEIRDRIAIWAENFNLDGNYPDLPTGVEDRSADVWECLIAIADFAGEPWSTRVRAAAVALVAQLSEKGASLGIRLLTDLRQVFLGNDRLPTETILQRLNDMEEAPWGELRGKPLNARSLANYLKRYNIHSKTIRTEAGTPKGYTREDLYDAWVRYLPETSEKSATSETSATNGKNHTKPCFPVLQA
jgi:hypothetical protein